MSGFYRLVAFGSWGLGLLTTILVLVSRVTRPLRFALTETVEMRSLLWLAGVFFLAAIATVAIQRTSKA
jgi:hypothetical protein